MIVLRKNPLLNLFCSQLQPWANGCTNSSYTINLYDNFDTTSSYKQIYSPTGNYGELPNQNCMWYVYVSVLECKYFTNN